MTKDREKEIKYLMYLKSEVIRNEKSELKRLRTELESLNQNKGQKKKRRQVNER